jgi:hypothetical protein
MRPISGVADQELLWVQPAALKQVFVLMAGEDVVATLIFQRGTLASVETADQRWTFKREGFWHPQVTVRKADAEENQAVFRPNWGSGGTLEFADGGTLRFAAANFWHSQWAWLLPDGRSGIHFHNKGGFLKSGAEVKIQDVLDLPDMALLVALGWYLLVLFARDAASTTSAAVVAPAH